MSLEFYDEDMPGTLMVYNIDDEEYIPFVPQTNKLEECNENLKKCDKKLIKRSKELKECDKKLIKRSKQLERCDVYEERNKLLTKSLRKCKQVLSFKKADIPVFRERVFKSVPSSLYSSVNSLQSQGL